MDSVGQSGREVSGGCSVSDERKCAWCGGDISQKRANAKFCKKLCRGRWRWSQGLDRPSIENRKKNAKRYREAHPEKVKAATYKWRLANAETYREKKKAWEKANASKRYEYGRPWRESHKEQLQIYMIKWRSQNRSRLAETKREWGRKANAKAALSAILLPAHKLPEVSQ